MKMESSSTQDPCVASTEDRRLWIGNLDHRVTEYQLLKLVQKHGTIEKFDLIFHRNGPQAGLPRGYAFVTYSKQEEAVLAKNAMNNLLVGQKIITVTWAHSIKEEEVEKAKPDLIIPALAMSKGSQKTDRVTQIQAIEAKLKLMEGKKDDELKINDTVASKPPVIVQFQQNKVQPANNGNSFKLKHPMKRYDKYGKPYSRNTRRR